MHEIRRATIDDIVAVAEFQTATWNEAYRDLVPADYLARMTVETRTERWGDRIRRNDRHVLLAVAAWRIEGIVSFGLRSDDRAGPPLELMSLYVAANARGLGLGTELLQLAVGNGPAVLWVFATNARAIAFYRQRGFELDGYEFPDRDTGMPIVRMSRSEPTNWPGR